MTALSPTAGIKVLSSLSDQKPKCGTLSTGLLSLAVTAISLNFMVSKSITPKALVKKNPTI